MSVHVTEKHLQEAEKLVRSLKGTDGLARVDAERFWRDQEEAARDPWSQKAPQVPLGLVRMGLECVWTELGMPENWDALTHDPAYRAGMARRYNDVSEKIVGRRLLNETPREAPEMKWPVKELYDIFEAKNIWNGMSYWLHASANTPDELQALLDRVERRMENLREFLLPPNWAEEKERRLKAGLSVPLYRSQRGPVTFAMSIYGVENLIYLILDQPDLARRFSDLIRRAMLARAALLDEEAGHTPETAPHGWSWADDNCAMLNKEMYDFFARPILQALFDRHAPAPGDSRYQHSDSDMAQHLPTLGELGLTGCNFGPNLTVTEIRYHLPRAVINGQLAPFTFSRNEEVNIVAEFLRDREMAQEKRGLSFTTAGSINDGSRLSALRLLMAMVQTLKW